MSSVINNSPYPFCFWLFWLAVMFIRFIHVACGSKLIFSLLCNICFMNIPKVLCPLCYWRHWDCFQLLEVSLNKHFCTNIQHLKGHMYAFLLDRYPVVGLLIPVLKLKYTCVILVDTAYAFLKGIPNYIFTSSVCESIAPHPYQHLVLSVIKI